MDDLTRKRGFTHAVVTASLIIVVSVLTTYKKELFVAETGHIQLFGRLGIFLGIGLVLRLRYVREFLAIITAMSILPLIVFLLYDVPSSKLIARLWLITLYVTITFLLLASKDLKNYTRSAR